MEFSYAAQYHAQLLNYKCLELNKDPLQRYSLIYFHLTPGLGRYSILVVS